MLASTSPLSIGAHELKSLIELRHDLHAHPEIGMQEQRTSRVIVEELQAIGVAYRSGLGGGTGVVAHIPGGTGPTIALRADIDALPIKEATNLPYASKVDGVMHACGHDGHTAILLGAARVLHRMSESGLLPGPVTLIFQPAEENLGGAAKMIESGCLDGVIGNAPSSIFGLHGWPWLELGSIGVRNGPLLASTDYFRIRITGRGAHAAWPHLSADPIVAACAIVTALQTIVSRNTDPLDSVVVSVCELHAGDTSNVIGETASIVGTLRTLSPESRNRTISRVNEIAEFTARAHGCQVAESFSDGCPATINDPRATDTVRQAVSGMSSAKLIEVPSPCMGGEDFAWYSQRIPASFFLLGLQSSDRSPMPALHHPCFDFNDDAIATGIEAFCRIATTARTNLLNTCTSRD